MYVCIARACFACSLALSLAGSSGGCTIESIYASKAAMYCCLLCSFPRRQKSRTWGGRENTGRAFVVYLPNPVVRHRGSSPATACVVTTKGASRMNCTSFRMIGSVLFTTLAMFGPRTTPTYLLLAIIYAEWNPPKPPTIVECGILLFYLEKSERARPVQYKIILEIKYCKIYLLPVLWSFHPEQRCMYVRAQYI